MSPLEKFVQALKSQLAEREEEEVADFLAQLVKEDLGIRVIWRLEA